MTLCGSTKFKEEYEFANQRLTLEGKVVLPVGCFMHADNIDISVKDKEALDRLHLEKIDMSDGIYVLNVGGYVGSSTSNEIKHALKTGKAIHCLEGDLTTLAEGGFL